MAETQKDLAEYQTDHDIIIEMRADFRGMRGDIQRLTEATTIKADDHEKRIRTVEYKVERMSGSTTVWRLILLIVLPLMAAAIGWVFVQFYTLESSLDKRISTAITTQLINYSLIKGR